MAKEDSWISDKAKDVKRVLRRRPVFRIEPEYSAAQAIAERNRQLVVATIGRDPFGTGFESVKTAEIEPLSQEADDLIALYDPLDECISNTLKTSSKVSSIQGEINEVNNNLDGLLNRVAALDRGIEKLAQVAEEIEAPELHKAYEFQGMIDKLLKPSPQKPVDNRPLLAAIDSAISRRRTGTLETAPVNPKSLEVSEKDIIRFIEIASAIEGQETILQASVEWAIAFYRELKDVPMRYLMSYHDFDRLYHAINFMHDYTGNSGVHQNYIVTSPGTKMPEPPRILRASSINWARGEAVRDDKWRKLGRFSNTLPVKVAGTLTRLATWSLRSKIGRRFTGAGAASVFASFLAVGAWGYSYVPGMIENSKKKLAVEIVSGGESVGYVYGERVKADKHVKGVDRSVPIDPKELEEGGELYYAYWALVLLEDKYHEGGITDWIGVHPNIIKNLFKKASYKITRTLSGGKVSIPKSDPGGGSTLADQACGQAQEKLPFAFDHSRTYDLVKDGVMMDGRKRVPSGKFYDPLLVKAVDTACGMGLAMRKTPKEIGALYLTFNFLASNAQGVGPFIRTFWGFDKGIHDSRLTIGHQLVLASLVRYTWVSETSDKGKNGGQQRRWEALTVARAKLAADRLMREGILTLDSLKAEGLVAPKNIMSGSTDNQNLWIRDTVYAQIQNARPLTYAEVQQSPRGYELYPKGGYDYLIYRAIEEARMAFGEDFREKVQTIDLTSNGFVQGKLIRAIQRELVNIGNPAARGVGLLAEDDGNIVAAFSGRLNEYGTEVLYDSVDRVFDSESELGSLGKFFLAAAAAQHGYSVDDSRLSRSTFRYNLRHSDHKIVSDAHRIGLDMAYVRRLINLFGKEHAGWFKRDFFEEAAMGSYSTDPSKLIGFVKAARTGKALPPLHMVKSFTLRSGSKCKYGPSGVLNCVDKDENHSAINPEVNLHAGFSDLAFNIDVFFPDQESNRRPTILWDWMSVPLELADKQDSKPGTLHALNGIVDAGKTGTVGRKEGSDDQDGTTKGAWVLIGTEPQYDASGRVIVPALSGVFGIAADAYMDSSGRAINFGNSVQGGSNPAFIAKDTILEAKFRLKK